MHLSPYADPAQRWYKVCKHVFAPAERWWELTGALDAWAADWRVLQGGGCFNGLDGWRRAGRRPDTLDVVTRHHATWLDAAGRACDEAREAGRVFPTDRPGVSCYVGEAGVTVYVADGSQLVTCFRPSRCVGSRVHPAEAAELAAARARQRAPEAWFPRAAVRRAQRRASLAATALLRRSPLQEHA